MHEIAVMNKEGDTRTSWNPADADSVAVAKALFERLRASGHMVYKTVEGESEIVREFDPQATDLVAVPRIVGG
jgi:hypothetical protein